MNCTTVYTNFHDATTIKKCQVSGITKKKGTFPQPKTVPCNFLGCKEMFLNRFNLRRHVLLVHCRTRAFKCPICHRRFGLVQHLREHVSSHYEAQKQCFQYSADRVASSPSSSAAVVPQVQPATKKLEAADIRGSLASILPIFTVEHTKEEDLLHAYMETKNNPSFVFNGRLPTPKNFHSNSLETSSRSYGSFQNWQSKEV